PAVVVRAALGAVLTASSGRGLPLADSVVVSLAVGLYLEAAQFVLGRLFEGVVPMDDRRLRITVRGGTPDGLGTFSDSHEGVEYPVLLGHLSSPPSGSVIVRAG
ncbi:hypothetical protein, partial [Sinomonas notoginsengisoli]